MRALITPAQRTALVERLKKREIPQPNGCIEAKGVPSKKGYITLCIGSHLTKDWVRVRAHILAWETANNRLVPAGYVVRHKCDNPKCVNPAHLEIGTQKDNIHDAIRRGRRNAFGRQKLSPEKVLEIRRRAAAGESAETIAPDFDLKPHSVRGVIRGDSWGHVGGPTSERPRPLYPHGARAEADPLAVLQRVLEPVRHVQLPVRGVLNLTGE